MDGGQGQGKELMGDRGLKCDVFWSVWFLLLHLYGSGSVAHCDF